MQNHGLKVPCDLADAQDQVSVSLIASKRTALLCRAFYDRALAIDVREYSPFIVAEVTVEGKDMKEATGKGFRQVKEQALQTFVMPGWEYFAYGDSGQFIQKWASPRCQHARTAQVAEFIFGGNVKEGKIEMTSPVQTQTESKPEDDSEKIAMTTPVATEMSGGR